jgi:ABC-type multidrug transport system fused ATPase/permease subunit
VTPPPAGPAPARRIRDYFRRHLLSFGIGVACLIGTQAAALAVPPLLKQATDALLEGRPEDVKNAAWWMLLLAVGGSVIRILSRVLIFNSGGGSNTICGRSASTT